MDPADEGYHGELHPNATQEEVEKHRKFEELRKKHYEMKNVKDLLGHPEDEDEDEEAIATQRPIVVEQTCVGRDLVFFASSILIPSQERRDML
ncbi:IPP-2 domain containing protein [Pyrenophora tritici-repentis]|nr:IPP-2 domain containing protein [Pyrenophora tritici-repentis]